mmetsp:Transcript_1928/g.2759  ORF Transcript_1928/g.2759 Transcript_1928/m.2759 type:complete len:118 (+) Transcript_1928:1428-1781(+)
MEEWELYEETLPPIEDSFGPLTASTKSVHYLHLPSDDGFQFHLIDTEDKIENELRSFINDGDEPVGIDSEWRPSMNVFHQSQGPSILQLSTSKQAVIVDLLTLRYSEALAAVLKELF